MRWSYPVDEIIESLFATQRGGWRNIAKRKHEWHEEKHIRAFLSDKHGAIAQGFDNLLKRDPWNNKDIIVRDRALKKAVGKIAKDNNMLRLQWLVVKSSSDFTVNHCRCTVSIKIFHHY